jgi:hypothetical protein
LTIVAVPSARGQIGSHLQKEMVMRKLEDRSTKGRRRRRRQVDLFHPAAARPTWESLPPSVRRTVTELLARLFSDASKHSEVLPPPARGFEEGDADA